MIENLLFDLDGTLIDSRADLASAVNHALTSVGLPTQTQQEIVPHVGNGVRVLLGEVMGPVSEETLDAAIVAFSEHYRVHCVDQTVLYEHVADVLAALASRHKLAVVTNKPEGFSRKILDALGVSRYLTTVVGGDSLPQRKPHPAPVFRAIRDLGERGQSLILGDGVQDVQAGQAAGILTCAAEYGFGFRKELLETKPNFQIKRFIELKEIVS